MNARTLPKSWVCCGIPFPEWVKRPKRRAGWGVSRNHQERHAEAIGVGRAPAIGLATQLEWWDVIVPAAPVIPDDEDGGVLPIWDLLTADRVGTGAPADAVHDVRNVVRPRTVVFGGVVRPFLVRDHPAYGGQLAVVNVRIDGHRILRGFEKWFDKVVPVASRADSVVGQAGYTYLFHLRWERSTALQQLDTSSQSSLPPSPGPCGPAGLFV